MDLTSLLFPTLRATCTNVVSQIAVFTILKDAHQPIALAKAKEYSPELLQNFIIKELSSGTLEIRRCISCQARFYVSKPAQTFYTGHQCQHCGSPLVETDVTGPEIIRKALAALAPRVYMVTQTIKPKSAS
jgi:hypothetical protein